MVDFRTLLSKNLEDVKAPTPLPAGTWTGQITAREFGESQRKKTPYVRFTIGNLQPGEDIDQEDLAGVELAKKTVNTTMYLSEDAQFRVKNLVEDCGFGGPGKSLAEGIEDLINAQVIFSISHRPSEDGQQVFVEVNNVKAAQ